MRFAVSLLMQATRDQKSTLLSRHVTNQGFRGDLWTDVSEASVKHYLEPRDSLQGRQEPLRGSWSPSPDSVC